MGRSSKRPRLGSTQTPPRQTPSSSVDSSDDPPPLLNSSAANGDHVEAKSTYLVDTELRLGLGGNNHVPSDYNGEVKTEKRRDWTPITAGSFFVKVYMEGVVIGRKIDILAHNNYDDLVASLARMFDTKVHCSGESATTDHPNKHHMLTYEDNDGDWMMAGDVPWEMFQCTVKRMMITRADKC